MKKTQSHIRTLTKPESREENITPDSSEHSGEGLPETVFSHFPITHCYKIHPFRQRIETLMRESHHIHLVLLRERVGKCHGHALRAAMRKHIGQDDYFHWLSIDKIPE